MAAASVRLVQFTVARAFAEQGALTTANPRYRAQNSTRCSVVGHIVGDRGSEDVAILIAPAHSIWMWRCAVACHVIYGLGRDWLTRQGARTIPTCTPRRGNIAIGRINACDSHGEIRFCVLARGVSSGRSYYLVVVTWCQHTAF